MELEWSRRWRVTAGDSDREERTVQWQRPEGMELEGDLTRLRSGPEGLSMRTGKGYFGRLWQGREAQWQGPQLIGRTFYLSLPRLHG